MNQFTQNRASGENLRQFFARHTNDELRSILAGGYAEPVKRDAAAAGVGAVPVGIDN